jgi:hypothetical protein
MVSVIIRIEPSEDTETDFKNVGTLVRLPGHSTLNWRGRWWVELLTVPALLFVFDF